MTQFIQLEERRNCDVHTRCFFVFSLPERAIHNSDKDVIIKVKMYVIIRAACMLIPSLSHDRCKHVRVLYLESIFTEP